MWSEKEVNAKGKTQYRFREYYYDKVTGTKKTVSVTFARDTKAIRERALLDLNEKIKEKHAKSSREITFGGLTNEWLKDYKDTVKAATYMTRKHNVSRFPDSLMTTPLNKLDYAQFNRFLRSLKRKGLVKSTINAYYSAFRLILNYGFGYGDIKDKSLIERITLPTFSTEESDKDFKFLEQDELDLVIAQLRGRDFHEVARMCLLQAYTGTRHGELIAIDYENNIDWKNQTILIDRTWSTTAKVFNLPKNNKIRTISFNDQAENLLKEQIQHTKIKTMLNGFSKDTFLFKNTKGEPFSYMSTQYPFSLIEIPNKNISSHIFRHTFIARAMEQNLPLHLIAEHVGNTTETIEKHYKHFTKNMRQQLESETDLMDFGS